MFKKIYYTLFACFSAALIFALLSALPAAAQNSNGDELKLGMSRDFGYSSGSGQIQGSFSMKVSGPDNLTRVVYSIDDQVMGEMTAAPFRFRFTTDSYPVGIHTLSAVGYTADGREINSNVIRAQFVTAEEGWQSAGKILIPILVLVGIAMVASMLPTLMGRKAKTPLGAERKYGFAGGAICPKCKRPFSMNVFGLNLLVGKLDRCPYCGHWGIMRATSMAKLREAEQAELALADSNGTVPTASEEEKLRKELDDSRFQDL